MSTGVIQSNFVGIEYRDIAPGLTKEGALFIVWIESVELQDQLNAYDPSSGTSPSVSNARTIARPILNAALAGPPEDGDAS